MSSDAQRRVYSELTAVLKEFGIQYESIRRSHHPALSFTVKDKRMSFTYSDGGDRRGILNAKSQLRNNLLAMGARPLPQPTLSLPKKPEEVSVTFEPKVSEPIDAPEEIEIKAPETKAIETFVQIIPDEPEVIVEENPAEEKLKRFNPDEVYALYQPKRLAPGRAIVIELENDFVAEKGSLLVIPLHKANTIVSFTRQQFELLYEGVVEDPIVPQPVEIKQKEEPQPVVEESFSEMEYEDEPIVQVFQEGISGKRPLPKASPMGPGSIDGVGPQLGRVLAAMAYVSDSLHRTDITPSMMNTVLEPPDRRQYASRMIKAIQLGLATRGLPLVESRGWHNKITPAGRKVVAQLKTWPWTRDGLTIPEWVKK